MKRHSAKFLLVLLLIGSTLQAGSVLSKAGPLGEQDSAPAQDPLRFLEKCLERYGQTGIKGYTATFHKQERISGELKPSEEIEIFYREKPHSVLMRWLKGERKASSALFVEGENEGMMLARPAGIAGKLISYVRRDPEGEEAKQSSRYSIKELGLREALERTIRSWKEAKAEGTLRVQYLGIRKVPEAGNKECHVFKRTNAKPEEEGVLESTFYLEKDTGFQLGSVLKGQGGKLMGEYFFRNVRVNPEFKPEQFQSSALSQ